MPRGIVRPMTGSGSPNRILLIKLRAMGDTVIALASLDALRHAYPHAQIDVLVTEAWSKLLVGDPRVNRVMAWPRSHALARLFTALAVRRAKYDCIVNLHASPTSARIARFSRAPVRSVHFHGHNDANQFSTVEVPGKGKVKPITERDLDTVRALGCEVPSNPGLLPRLPLRPEERERGSAVLRSLKVQEPILGLGLGASRPTKQWPLERYAELAREWKRKTGGDAVGVVGSGEEKIQRALPEIKFMPKIGLRDLAAALSQLSVFAGNDSGPRHLAAAVGTPTVTLFGPEEPFEWHPYPRDRHPALFREGLACRKDADPGMPAWCGLSECTVEKHRCMVEIKVSAVLEEALRIMDPERPPDSQGQCIQRIP